MYIFRDLSNYILSDELKHHKDKNYKLLFCFNLYEQ